MGPGPPDPEAKLSLLCWTVSWRCNGGFARDSSPGNGTRDSAWGQGLSGQEHVGNLTSTFCIILNPLVIAHDSRAREELMSLLGSVKWKAVPNLSELASSSV